MWIILFFVVVIILWIIYHKIFTVYYFDLGGGLLKEFLGCCMVSGFICGFLKEYLPYVIGVLAVIAVIVLIFVKSKNKQGGQTTTSSTDSKISPKEKEIMNEFLEGFRDLSLVEKKDVLSQIKKKAETENTVATGVDIKNRQYIQIASC